MLLNIHRSHNNFLDDVIQLHSNYALDNLQGLEIIQSQVWQWSCKGILSQVAALNTIIPFHISRAYGKTIII